MKVLALVFVLISIVSFAQKAPEKYDTISLSTAAAKTLADFDKQIKELQDKQNLYLRGLFEGKNYDVDKVKDLRFEKGKFIFRTEK